MNWHKPAGTLANDGWEVDVRPGSPEWSHTGLLVGTLPDGETRTVETTGSEFVVVPLAGRVVVSFGGGKVALERPGTVFDGPADVAYVPRNSTFTVTAAGPARVALCHAPASTDHPFQVVPAGEVPVETRGAGNASRQVHNFATPDAMRADSIICCEVLTPAGNWSSYPPHKHDTERPGEETQLEEIYYFEVQSQGPSAGDPHGYQVVYSADERPIDVDTQVRSGDVVLVPHGWHGPSMAPPGYHLYYLNVMAGPGPERAWRIVDDPNHAWVRETWASQSVDPRLPFPINSVAPEGKP
ncbi:5-deoxy-glucuronate isomerase [Calidifontibacter terrae]